MTPGQGSMLGQEIGVRVRGQSTGHGWSQLQGGGARSSRSPEPTVWSGGVVRCGQGQPRCPARFLGPAWSWRWTKGRGARLSRLGWGPHGEQGTSLCPNASLLPLQKWSWRLETPYYKRKIRLLLMENLFRLELGSWNVEPHGQCQIPLPPR